MSGSKRDVWNLCQYDEALAQLVRDFGMECSPRCIQVKANGQYEQWGDVPDGRANWERHNGDPRDGEAWQRWEQRIRRAGL